MDTRVERLWPKSTVVCLATGPSLTAEDVDYCLGRARVIAVNDAYRLAPWADALYACDPAWWRWHDGVKSFQGAKWSMHHDAWSARFCAAFSDVARLKNTGETGLELDPSGLRAGRNSGYQAINLAVHYGATRIVLLGYDLQRTGGRAHFFGNHPQAGQNAPYASFIPYFQTLISPLNKAGVSIVNCTPSTALTCFDRSDLRAALSASSEVAA
jgi:hypothetical protein